jgi:hypothetical protein
LAPLGRQALESVPGSAGLEGPGTVEILDLLGQQVDGRPQVQDQAVQGLS